MTKALLALIAVALIVPATASAAPDLKVGIADDAVLLGKPSKAPSIVARWARSGVDVVRIHVRWIGVAPAKHSRHRPKGFHAGDPDDRHYRWHYLDRAIDLVRFFGMEPVLSVTGSGPLWSSLAPSRGDPAYKPSAHEFGQFAQAVARRYGDRVDRYLIWNEPNQPGWLRPQFDCRRGRGCTPFAPHLYRRLVRAAYPRIRAADPGADVVAGTLAPRGADPTRPDRPMRPLTFLRAFGCVDAAYRRVRSGPCAGFRPATIDGFAYHPHGVFRSPSQPNPQPDEAAIADLPRLERALDRVQRARGFRTPDGHRVPLHITEFGYQTNPPDREDGVSPAQQKAWLQQAAYLAWRDPRVHTLIQYEWLDEPVHDRGGDRRRYGGWQSGLFYANGRPKPAAAVFTHPFWADVRPGASKVRFWGQVRPGERHAVGLLRRTSAGRWQQVDTVQTDADGYWSARLPVRYAADFRFRYEDAPPVLPPPSPDAQPEDAAAVMPRGRIRYSGVQRVR